MRPNHTDPGDIETLIQLIRNAMMYGQSKKDIAHKYRHLPNHVVFHAYAAAEILNRSQK